MYAIDRAGPDEPPAPLDVRPTRTDPMSTPAPARHHPAHVADRYVDAVCDLDPIVATSLGTRPGDDRLPDLGPAGLAAEEALVRGTLAELDRVLAADPSLVDDPIERRCARLLRERLGAELAVARGRRGLPVAEQPVQPGARRPAGLHDDAGGDRGGLGRHRPPDGAGAGGLPAATARRWRRARDAGCSSRRARCAPSSAQLDEWLAGPYFAVVRRRRPRGAARRAGRRRAGRRRGGRRDARLPPRRVRAAAPRARRTPSAASATPVAVRRWTGSDLGAGRRARGGLRLGLGGAPADPRRAADRGRAAAPGRDADGGHALGRRARPGRRGRRGDPRAAAGDDGRRDRGAGRHALRPRRAGPPGRGDDRAPGQRRRAVLHAAGAGLLPARAAPGCRRSAGPASRSGTSSRSGTTRAFPAITSSSRSGPTSPGSCRRTRRRWARSAPTSRAGRCTPSG